MAESYKYKLNKNNNKIIVQYDSAYVNSETGKTALRC